MKTFAIAIVLSAAAMSLAYGTSLDNQSDEARIRMTRAMSNQAIRDHDTDAIVASFTDTYQITTGSGLLFHDTPADEKKLWAEIFDTYPDVLYVRKPKKIEVSTYLPRAAESGDWVGTWTTDKGPIEVGGTYSASWIQVGGHWKIQSEMFVSLYCSGEGC